jgi:hypothetical protein
VDFYGPLARTLFEQSFLFSRKTELAEEMLERYDADQILFSGNMKSNYACIYKAALS